MIREATRPTSRNTASRRNKSSPPFFDENTTFDVSDSSGRPIAFGRTSSGRFIVVVFEVLNPADPLVVSPITAYDVPEPME
jgi:hypothetical protein